MARGGSRERQQRLALQAEKLDRVSAKLSAKAAQLQQMSERLDEFDLWTRPEPGARQTRLTRDDIATAALRIADADGFEALSMRRLATELDVGTMSLYHYVHNKDELLALLSDAVMGELVVPAGELPDDWRAALVAIGRRTRDTLMRHPWVLDLQDDPQAGPNSIRHFDQTMQAVASLDIPLRDKADLATAIDEYVFGHCFHARQESARGADGHGRLFAYLDRMIDTGRFPALAAIRERFGVQRSFAEIEKVRTDPTRFERNLNRLLDGFGY